MELDLNWINILILFGATQGIVFTGILLSYKKHPGGVFLASVIFAMVYNALETFNWSAGLDRYSTFFDFFPYVAIFLVGPGFYLYYKSLLIPGFVASRKELLLLFSPFIFQLTYATIKAIGYFAYFQLNLIEIAIPLTWLFHVYDIYSEIWSLLVFLFLTLLSVNFVRKNIPHNKADLRQKEISHWVRSLLVFQMVFAIGWTFTLLAPIWYNGEYGTHYYPESN